MIIELLALALASTVRPTSLAAVSALLAHTRRRRLMFAYVVVGLAFTVGFGVVVVGAMHGIHLNAGTDEHRGVLDIVSGTVIVLFGVAVMTGLVRRRQGHAAPDVNGRWKARLDQRVTVPLAAAAGPLTHIPGIFYLLALNVIVAHNPRLPGGLFSVLLYDAVWFALPLGALAVCVVNPDAAQAGVQSVQRWTAQRARTIIVCASFVVGAALVVRGVLVVT